MTRSLRYPLAIVLALATAGTLLGLAAALPAAPVGAGDPTDVAGVARRFYAAVNAAIATGDPTDLDAVAWPDVAVDRADGDPWDLAALRRHLLALHDARSGGSLRVEEVIAHDRRAVALVAVEGAGAGGWVGVPGTAPTIRLAADRLRVAAGRVVTYAGIATALSAPQRVLEGDVEAPPPALGPLGWGLARVRLAPGADLSFFTIPGPVLYAVEDGELALRWDGAAHLRPAGAEGPPRAWEIRGRDRAWTLRPGDQVVIEAGASYEARNAGTTPTSALAAAILPEFGAASAERGGAAAGAPGPWSWPSAPAGTPGPSSTHGAGAGSTVSAISDPMNGRTPGAALTQAMFRPPAGGDGTGAIWPAGVTVTPLAAAPLAPEALPGTAHVRLTVERLVLAPGQRGEATAAGPTVLAAETGRGVVVAVPVSAAADATPGTGVTAVTVGEAASAAAGERLAVHNLDAAPLVVLALTLTPAGAPDETATPP